MTALATIRPSNAVVDVSKDTDTAVPSHLKFVVPYVGNEAPEARNRILKALANDAGLRLPDTRLPEGTALLPVGDEARRALKVELDALPDLQPALDAYERALQAEDPKDTKIPKIQQVRMSSETGGLYGDPSTKAAPIAYTQVGFSQVAAFVKPPAIRNGFAENITALPNKLRAEVFNHWAQSSTRDNAVVLRSFKGGSGSRIIRAVTGPMHSLVTGDDRSIVQALRSALPGAKVRFTREPGGETSQLELIWPMLDRQLRVGDVAHGGIRITNSETKAGSLRVEAFVLRVLCYNFTTAFSMDMDAETFRHVGDLTPKLAPAIERTIQRIEPLVLAFGDAFKDKLPEAYPTSGEVLERVGKVFALKESTLSRAAGLWDADGAKSAGLTRAGLVNALTRASQEEGITEASRVEREAGRIILDGWSALA